MSKKILIIGGSTVAALLVILLVVVFIWPKPFAGDKEDASGNGSVLDLGDALSSSMEFARRQDQLETLREILNRERESLDAISQKLKEQEERIEQKRQDIEQRRADLAQSQGVLGDKQIALAQESRTLNERERELEVREKKIINFEREQEEKKPVPAPKVSFDEEAKAREHKKMARGFSSMRPKDVASLLTVMMQKGDEGHADAISLLKKTSPDLKMRILSALAKDDITMAAELTQTLMMPATD
ncbi:TPA: hypothetical protein EYM26_13425 [Candidatus Poribacteria bacterium]|nr:hypothetical protein [Candidatus Poribacteria bacterium]